MNTKVTDRVALLEELAKKWRQQAVDIHHGEGSHRSCKTEELKGCADEIDATIALMRVPVGDDEEQLRAQLAGCGVISMCNTRESLAEQMPERGAYGYSDSLEQVRRAVMREIDERERADSAERSLRMAVDSAPAGSGEVERQVREANTRIIIALAAIVNLSAPDPLTDVDDVIPRDPVMAQIHRIKAAADEMAALLRKLQQGTNV